MVVIFIGADDVVDVIALFLLIPLRAAAPEAGGLKDDLSTAFQEEGEIPGCLPIQELNKLAAKSPSAVFKLAGIGDQKKTEVPGKTSSSVNTTGFQQSQHQPELSAKLPKGATTKDLVNAWHNAGVKVKQNLGIS